MKDIALLLLNTSDTNVENRKLLVFTLCNRHLLLTLSSFHLTDTRKLQWRKCTSEKNQICSTISALECCVDYRVSL